MRKKKTSQHLTLSPREVARVTGLGVASTYALLRSGEMPSIKAGKKYFVPRSALLRWLEECRTSSKLMA
jgi:excisionase family DNA binding protein